MVAIPRLVVAAPASGHGKTTVATGLIAAYAARGLAVAGFKVGPDYIDPGYHALASGRPGRNLDPVLVGSDLIGPLFAHGAAGASLAVVEGVMGLYDGRARSGTGPAGGDPGCTADVAALLSAPVLLVVDAAAQGRSIAALVHGFRSFGTGIRLGGVVLNRVGSDRHEAILRAALDEVGLPVLGVLRRHAAIAVPSRHLGLVPVAERHACAVATVAALAALIAGSVDLEGILVLASTAPPLPVVPWSPVAGDLVAGEPVAGDPVTGEPVAGDPVPGRPVVAVAGGPAFSFSYTETVELLAGAGAEVSIVDPLHDPQLPPGTAALVVGGGFPEVYAAELAANVSLRAEVAALARSGAPVAAECAGLLWLCRSLDGVPMCGVLDADAVLTDRLTLGYRDAVAVSESWLGPAGTRVTGHEFHRTVLVPPASGALLVPPLPPPVSGVPAWAWRGQPAEGFIAGGVHASYLHLHWAGQPSIARGLVRVAARQEVAAG